MDSLSQKFQEHHYSLFITADGSPTLHKADLAHPQTMHHRGGAFSETEEIYGKTIEATLQKGGRKFLVVGLGLGYIELAIASRLLGESAEACQILSFESDAFLVHEFVRALSAGPEGFYKDIFALYPASATENLVKMHQSGRWKIFGALDEKWLAENSQQASANCLLFDAYSTKASPELWTPEFLDLFFSRAADEKLCLFSTYACTSVLKQSLLRNDFVFEKKPGFLGKRDSSFASRIN